MTSEKSNDPKAFSFHQKGIMIGYIHDFPEFFSRKITTDVKTIPSMKSATDAKISSVGFTSAVKPTPSSKSLNNETQVVAIQRKNGQIIVGCDVYIGRQCYRGGWNLPKSPFANPFTVKKCGSVEKAVEKYEEYIRGRKDLLALLPQLKGKVLGCWCKKNNLTSVPCHGDVLVKLIREMYP